MSEELTPEFYQQTEQREQAQEGHEYGQSPTTRPSQSLLMLAPYKRSMMVTLACPPPSHMVCSP